MQKDMPKRESHLNAKLKRGKRGSGEGEQGAGTVLKRQTSNKLIGTKELQKLI